ncbi:hypothetical protein DWF00_10590 [Bosea caraganae]|uniref:Uncharacterized protein n=1 Tax=Bosea caraganae TaxID=2763117 RepID=A0A370LBR7_9HYPH|nr:hypothetical protein [Bosea caraganae]RDJ27398.1 hypothetical protein DWF00_10590 [Bosea caraganae]RDJ29414.1 hypothetical protein DWE98_02360 [Bosea caraganae]
MTRHSEEPVRSVAQRLADLERCNELRKEAQAHMAAAFEIWRACSRKSCRRSQRCAGPSVATCLSEWSSNYLDDATRAVLQAGVKARLAGAGVEEACAVAEALAERIEAERAAAAAGTASAPLLTPPASSPRTPPRPPRGVAHSAR